MKHYQLKVRYRMYLIVLVIACCFQAKAQAPYHVWAKSMGGAGNESPEGVATDTAGNVYITGYFYSGSADFDPGTPVAELIPNGANDMFIAKYDPQGNYLWANAIGGTGSDYSRAIGVDGAGNIYITGNFQDTVDFDPGPGTQRLVATPGKSDMFIAKYNPGGDFIWVKQIGAGATSIGMAVDAAGNMYITGELTATVDFDPAATVNAVPTSGGSDVFVAKYDSSGSHQWAFHAGNSNSARPDGGAAIALDNAGNVYVTGYFYSKADFDPSPAPADTANLTSNGGIGDIFVAKYSNSGSYIWAKNLGGTGRDEGHGIAVDAAGNVYVTGHFIGKADFNPGTAPADTVYLVSNNNSADIFLAKLNSSGNYVWAHSIFCKGSSDEGNGVAADAAGDVYLTGIFTDTAYFDQGAGTSGLVANGGSDILVARYDAAGNNIWAKNFGGSASTGTLEQGIAITLNTAGDAVITGIYQDTADFDPGPGTDTLKSQGGAEIFMLRLSEHCEIYTNFTERACDSFRFNGVTYTATGIYVDTFASALLCDSIVTLDLTVYSTPQAAVTKNGSTLTADSAGGYHWLDCDNGRLVPEAGSRSYTPPRTGNYAVIMTTNGCSDTSDCVSVEGTGIGEIAAGQQAWLYPNPFRDRLTIETGHALKNGTIRVIRTTGQLLLEQKGQQGTLFTVDMSKFPAGIYFVEISEGTQTFRMKAVRE